MYTPSDCISCRASVAYQVVLGALGCLFQRNSCKTETKSSSFFAQWDEVFKHDLYLWIWLQQNTSDQRFSRFVAHYSPPLLPTADQLAVMRRLHFCHVYKETWKTLNQLPNFSRLCRNPWMYTLTTKFNLFWPFVNNNLDNYPLKLW